MNTTNCRKCLARNNCDPSKSCVDNLYDYFKSQGKLTFKYNTHLFVISPENDHLHIEVYGMPDYPIISKDDINIYGYRGGLADILVDETPCYSTTGRHDTVHIIGVLLHELSVWLTAELKDDRLLKELRKFAKKIYSVAVRKKHREIYECELLQSVAGVDE